MKTLIVLIAAVLTVTTVTAQESFYQNGALIKVNDSVTLECTMTTNEYIGIQSTRQYPFAATGDVVTSPQNYSVFRRVFEETFTPEEREKYKDVMIGLSIIHDGKMNLVDVWFAIENKVPDNTIPPTKFVTIRQKTLDYVKLRANPYVEPNKYYRWYKGIGSVQYYLQLSE